MSQKRKTHSETFKARVERVKERVKSCIEQLTGDHREVGLRVRMDCWSDSPARGSG